MNEIMYCLCYGTTHMNEDAITIQLDPSLSFEKLMELRDWCWTNIHPEISKAPFNPEPMTRLEYQGWVFNVDRNVDKGGGVVYNWALYIKDPKYASLLHLKFNL